MPRLPEYESFDGLGLAALVRARDVTPLELIEAALDRIEQRNPALNAVVHLFGERARRVASGLRDDGPFLGVPLLLKDLLAALEGEPLTSGSRFLREVVPERDSELVIRLKRAGLVIIGRTNTPELGIMAVTEPALYGPTRNPWNLEHTPGGSSGGSAAAVASGMVPLAHGGDGGGSIRIPASCCGLFGLKPTRGRNPLGPYFGEGWNGLVQEHALTRSVRDSAALLDATSGPDCGAPYAAPPPPRPFLEEVGSHPGRLRIAYDGGSLFGATVHPDCRRAVEDAARLCAELGHEVSEARPPFDRDALRRAYLVIVTVGTARAIEAAAAALGRTPHAADFEGPTWLLARIGHHLSGVDHQRAIDTIHLATRRIAAFFAEHDLFLCSTMAHPPAKIGAFDPKPIERVAMQVLRALPSKRLMSTALDRLAAESFEATANTMLFNLTGQPAMSVPLAFDGAGLPIGIQLAARTGEEGMLFRLAAQLEAARPWFHRRPPVSEADAQPPTAAST